MSDRGAEAPGAGGHPRRRAIIAIGVGAVTIDAALLGLIAPLLPLIQERTGASDAGVGIALAAYAVPIALFSLPLGRAADRFGRRALLVLGLLLVAAGSVLIAESRSLDLLIVARMIQGIGSAASWISALALVSDTAPPGRRGASIERGARRHRVRLDRPRRSGSSSPPRSRWCGLRACLFRGRALARRGLREHERGLGYGVQNLLYAGGYAIGPVLGGWLLELSGADFAYLVTAGAIAVGTLLLVLRRPAV